MTCFIVGKGNEDVNGGVNEDDDFEGVIKEIEGMTDEAKAAKKMYIISLSFVLAMMSFRSYESMN